MKGICVTIFHSGEFIHEEVYLVDSKSDAIKRCKEKHPEFVGKEFKIVAKNYDTDECAMHFNACKKYGLVFFYDTAG